MKKKTKIIIIICCLVLILLLIALSLGSNSRDKVSTPDDVAAPSTEVTVPAEGVVQEIAAETPCGILYFPARWADRVRAEVVLQDQVTTVTYYGLNSANQEMRLFDVVFGETEAETLGLVKTESGEECPVAVIVYELDNEYILSEKDAYEFNAMQEEVNYLIEQLPIENREEVIEPSESTLLVQNERPAQYADVILQTPYATLAYPGELAGLLYVELEEAEPYGATFCWNNNNTPVKLFEIAFEGEEESRVGYLVESGRPVYLTVFDLEKENLNQEELNTALSLQETLNDVIDRLDLQSQPVEIITFNTYETPYGNLCYPDAHQQNLVVTINQDNGYRIEFCFLRENGETIALFDVCFGENADGMPVGQYVGADGVAVPVYLVSYSVDEECFQNDGERNLYYIMAEDVNFLFDKYGEMYPFTFN